MTFSVLLTKELRLHVRRERTVWVVVAYILTLGLLGWLYINNSNHASSYPGSFGSSLSRVGVALYSLLSLLQLFLIIFLTPAFTATTVNGEKERQTFDLLLCSRLSAFPLVAGKLLAGLMATLLLVAASVPLFSLVFFFGGVAPIQMVKALLVYGSTILLVGTFGTLCSTLFRRPAISTAITYMACLLWIGLPLILASMLHSSPIYTLGGGPVIMVMPMSGPGPIMPMLMSGPGPVAPPPLWVTWDPIVALMNTHGSSGYLPLGFSPLSRLYSTAGGLSGGAGVYTLWGLKLTSWKVYILLNVVISLFFVLLSMWMVRPNPLSRLHALRGRRRTRRQPAKVIALGS